MTRQIKLWIGLFIGIIAIGVGVIVAQTQIPTIPDDFTCDMAELIFLQDDFQRFTDTFDALYQENPDEALAMLYDTGKAYQKLALTCGYLPPDFASLAAGKDIAIIMNALENLKGDPVRGQSIYNTLEPSGTGDMIACAGCHGSHGANAPMTEGTWTRWDEIRRLEPQFAGYTFAQYIVESIVHPDAYVVEPFSPGIMPSHFGQTLTFQDIADIIMYLESQDQLLDE